MRDASVRIRPLAPAHELAGAVDRVGAAAVVARVELAGRPLCDVRILADCDGTGERRSTRKGICMKVGLIPDLIAALQAAEREAAR